MANRQIGVNLNFTANTQQAKQQLQQLQIELSNIVNNSKFDNIGKNLSTSLKSGVEAAKQLQIALSNATNQSTGKLDISKFSDSLSRAGVSLTDLSNKLIAIGPEGSTAFVSLSQSVASANSSAITLNSKLSGLLSTLKNVVKYQFSTAIYSKVTSLMHDAWSYAQDLNESLNNIRIVTGYNVEKMEEFAAKANKAAKALSTTTTAYTDASLIFYQQGD